MSKLVVFIGITLVTGCMNLSSPPANLDSRTVRRMGEPKPGNDKDYILYIPAGKPFNITVDIHGSFLRSRSTTQMPVKLDRGIYLYKYWVSYDRRQWKNLREFFAVKLQTGLGVEGGRVSIQVAAKK